MFICLCTLILIVMISKRNNFLKYLFLKGILTLFFLLKRLRHFSAIIKKFKLEFLKRESNTLANKYYLNEGRYSLEVWSCFLLLFLFLFLMRAHYVVQFGTELSGIVLPQSPALYWDYRHRPGLPTQLYFLKVPNSFLLLQFSVFICL